MKIAVDCRHISSSGVGVYLEGILPFFLASPHFFYLLGDSKALGVEGVANAEVIECGARPFSFSELFFFPKSVLAAVNSCDLFYSPFFNIPGGVKVPVYTTIHDIIFPDMPQLVSKLGLFARNFFYKRARRLSKKIFTVSEFSKSRILFHLGGEKPVVVTYSAIMPKILKYAESGSGGRPKKETIVFVGNIKKQKGLFCLFEAFSLLKKDGYPHKLLIIGKQVNFRSSHKDIFSKAVARERSHISFLGFLPDAEVMEHVSSAALLVQPSFYEGFCLPPLEALVLGTRVLLSDIPVLKEIYGGFPVSFFKSQDAYDLKEKMAQALSQGGPAPPLERDLLLKYNFEKTAAKILENF